VNGDCTRGCASHAVGPRTFAGSHDHLAVTRSYDDPMSRSPEDIARWQTELGNAFRGPRGLVGERLIGLQNAEKETQTEGIANYKGYVTAGDAFFDFAIQTLDILSRPVRVYHMMRVPLFVCSVSRLRSSYVLFWMGYYFDAASLLRGLFESAVHLCADAHRWGDLSAWFDASGINLAGPARLVNKEMRKRRQTHDQAVESMVFRNGSGLSEADQEALAMLLNVMHSHVHKTEMHLVYLVSKAQQTKLPSSVLPCWDDHQASHYGNVSLAIAWMFVRLLSHAVPKQHRSAEWTAARDVLDRSLRFWFEGWDKPLGGVIIRFIDAKFSFSGEWGEPSPSIA
jgi:hypothetical protein